VKSLIRIAKCGDLSEEAKCAWSDPRQAHRDRAVSYFLARPTLALAVLALSAEITGLLRAWSGGDQAALDRLVPAVYDELRRIARGYVLHERPGHTLQATALVNEAYLRLIEIQNVGWQDRAHFFAVGAQIMRRILVDRARAHARAKRGGAAAHVPLEELPEMGSWRARELIALDDALCGMAEIDPRKAKVIELRFFGGLSVEETAEVLKISQQSVMRDWKLGRAWLQRELAAQTDQRS
jgi:RNA polymerase sigma factor (TIGR02999 family)